MSKQWAISAAVILFIVCPLWSRPAQLAPEIVREISSALTPVLDVVCTDKLRITSFSKGKMTSQSVYDQTVASARTNGDRLTAFSEITSVNGVPLSGSPADSNINIGATFSDHRAQIFRNQASFFTFKTSTPRTSEGQREPGLLIAFELKKELPGVPSYLPDSGQALIDSVTKRIIRLEMRYLGLTQVPGPTFQNADSTVIENFGNVTMEQASVWMTTDSTNHHTNHANKDLTKTYVHEYSNCRKFRVSVTINTQD